MVQLVLDENQQSQLVGVDDAVLCDAKGNPLGHYLSEESYNRMIYDWAKTLISDEELERRRQAPGGKSLSEILERLQNS